MIVILGSRHDPVASSLAERWPGAALCSAEDLTRPGWCWPSRSDAEGDRWVVDGAVVPDSGVTGVFVRRATVYPEELSGTHRDDRAYLAAEVHAMLVYALRRTTATVVNPVGDGGAFGEDALRPERWMPTAVSLGVDVAPLVLRPVARPRPQETETRVEVVGNDAFGDAPASQRETAIAVCAALGLRWAAVGFDREQRLTLLCARAQPSDAAAAQLGQLLAQSPAA